MRKYTSIKPDLADINSWSMNDVMQPKYMVTMTGLVSAQRLDLVRDEYKKKGHGAPSYTALVMKAVSLVIKGHPEINRAIVGPPFFRRIIQFEHFDINVAVEKNLPNLPGQAYAPTIRDVANQSALEITEKLKFYGECTEGTDRHLSLFMKVLKWTPWPFAAWILNLPYWLPKLWIRHRGGACWVNAPSKSGADLVFTVWPWPVTFSFGMVKARPMVIDGRVVAESTIPLVMVFDRRLMGGGPAGRVFAEFKRVIEEADLG